MLIVVIAPHVSITGCSMYKKGYTDEIIFAEPVHDVK